MLVEASIAAEQDVIGSTTIAIALRIFASDVQQHTFN